MTGTVYLLHFDQPYKHARHYVGNPQSSAELKDLCSELKVVHALRAESALGFA